MKTITLTDAQQLTGIPYDALYKRVKRSGVVVRKNRHNEIVVPLGIALIPPRLAESIMRATNEN